MTVNEVGEASSLKAVLFDMDGTIVEFKFPIHESRIALFASLKQGGYKVDSFRESMRTQDIVDLAEAQWRESEALRQSQPFSDVKAGLFRILDGLEFDSLSKSRPFPGSLEMVKRLRNGRFLTGVVTNAGKDPALSLLSKYGFLPWFNVVLTRDDVPRMKPSPDGLIMAEVQLRLESNEILYVGDSVLDIEAAKAARMRIASIATDTYSEAALRKLSPDFVLSSINDLERIIFIDRS